MMKSTTQEFGRFFLPGPTEVRPEVLEAMLRPMIGHRVAEMEELIGHIQPGLKYVFQTERPVYISASSATGLMEGAVRNGARRKVLALVNGAFSERFYKITVATGLHADPLEVAWGEAHTPDMVEHALRRGIYDAVTVVHSETSTGVLNPIREIAQAVRAAGDVAILVDSVSGLGGTPLYADDWKLDFVLTGSQKCFALPPGLAFGVAQRSILERANRKMDRGTYFDFHEFERNIQKNQTPNTPAVSLMYALAAQLDAMRAETNEVRWDRHQEMADRVYAWVQEMNDRGVDLRILAPAGYRSPATTTILVPEPWTGPKVCAAVQARGYTIATGYGKGRDGSIRIGTMGDHTVAETENLLDALTDVFDV